MGLNLGRSPKVNLETNKRYHGKSAVEEVEEVPVAKERLRLLLPHSESELQLCSKTAPSCGGGYGETSELNPGEQTTHFSTVPAQS